MRINVLFLSTDLERKGFKAYTIPHGATSEPIAPLMGRLVLVTNNTGDFVEAAAIHGFSIADTSNASQDAITLAAEISQAWSQVQLKGKQPFILRLN